jgi:hypothetical protein
MWVKMEESQMKNKLLICADMFALSALIVLNASPSFAQVGNRPGLNRGPAFKKPAPKNYFSSLKEITDALAAKFEVKVVADPAIFVSTKPTAPSNSSNVFVALDVLVSQLKKVSWKRIYLTQNQGDVLPPPEKLAASIRAMELVEQSGIVLENPATRKGSTLIKNFDIPSNFETELKAQEFNPKGVYVLYSIAPGADGAKSMEDRFFDLQSEQMNLMMQMDGDQLSQAMARGMDLYAQLDPGTRSALMGQMMRSGMQMFMNMPADQRQQLMQDAASMFGGIGGGPGPGKP